MVKKISFAEIEVSRLIIGGNPFCGNSHISAELDEQMMEFFTTEKIKETLFRCQELGINAMQLRGDTHIFRILREFRNEGGNLKWIAQTASEYGSHQGNVNQIKKQGADAIYHHGSTTDALFKNGQIDELKQRLKIIRESGKLTGLGTHMPEVIEYAEEHNWDLDFYMASVYNISKVERVSKAITGKINEGEPFDDEDRPRMFEVIKKTDKPCLAFKILGAGRKCDTYQGIERSFRDAFENIKDNDAVVVGMYPKEKDQVKENVELVNSILNN